MPILGVTRLRRNQSKRAMSAGGTYGAHQTVGKLGTHRESGDARVLPRCSRTGFLSSISAKAPQTISAADADCLGVALGHELIKRIPFFGES
jgi:hypothetical protein